jgi:hypothetical protein
VAKHTRSDGHQAHSQFMERQAPDPKFLNANTTSRNPTIHPLPMATLLTRARLRVRREIRMLEGAYLLLASSRPPCGLV